VRAQIFRYLAAAGLVFISILMVLLLPVSQKSSQLLVIECSGQDCRQIELPGYFQLENMPVVEGGLALESADCPPGGIFKAGEIDLTGDGLPEQINLSEGIISVHKNGQEIWASDPSWQITDLTLGDPNDDGRYNILAIVWIEDEEGTAFCHPYIFGYRGGSVKLIWGGSAAIYPLQEVLLADIDGDGKQELIVIEAVDKSYKPGSNRGLTVVSVWAWRGWHYSLRWKSDPANYNRLSCALSNYLNDSEQGATVVVVYNN
jgi:hypothetical protein